MNSAKSKMENLDFQELLEKANSEKLFERTYFHYFFHFFTSVIGLIICFYVITLTQNIYIQILNAIVFAFFSVQIGIIGHDCSHGEVFKTDFMNKFMAIISWGVFGGLSEARWFEKHNRHHQHPNHIGHDPDLEIPFFFSQEESEKRSKLYKKYILSNQHILFWFALAFVYPYNILNAMRFIFKYLNLITLIELVLILAHFAFVVFFPLYFLPLNVALTFLFVSFLCIGLYTGVLFAPNHKGEDMLSEKENFMWVYQITFTRNINPSWWIFYLMGGLNFQVEHHLFPNMSRLKYWKAQKIVQEFCRKNSIPYHQTSWLGSMKEIHVSLKKEANRIRAQLADL